MGNCMPEDKSKERLVKKQDIVHIAILVAIALVIGVYLIVTTVMISKDGVYYIERVQQLTNNPIKIIKVHPPGYPFLILFAHKFTSFFVDSTSNQIWIYSAQGITLLCRLLAIIPLYLIGKLLVGGKNSFWGIMILSILPDSAAFGSDALTDWPHLMFLATGFLLLLLGAQYRKSWLFGWAGIFAGLGYLVRSEGCQLVIFGIAWLSINLIRPQAKLKRTKAAGALFLLLAGFAIIAIPYMRFTGFVFPDQGMLKLPAFLSFGNDSFSPVILAGLSVKRLVGNETLITNMCETLMYYFVPALLIGGYYYFRKQSKALEQTFFAAAFIIFNVVMLTWQSGRFLSRRHTLAMVVFTIFYIPIGLRVIAGWLSEKYPKNNVSTQKTRQQWFLILLVIGLVVCLPKLLKPIRMDKPGYLEAARWLKENTTPVDVIATPDSRITFYGERKGLIYKEVVPKNAKYVVSMVKDEDEKLKVSLVGREKYSVWANKKEKKKRIMVYEMF